VLNDIIKYTTQELLDIATQHPPGEEAARAVFILGSEKTPPDSNRVTPPKATGKGTKKGAKGGKKR
jgi:hypothetical protein